MLRSKAAFSQSAAAVPTLTLNTWSPLDSRRPLEVSAPSAQAPLGVFWHANCPRWPRYPTSRGGAAFNVASPSSQNYPAPLPQKNLRPVEAVDVWRRAWLVELMLKPRKWSKLLRF